MTNGEPEPFRMSTDPESDKPESDEPADAGDEQVEAEPEDHDEDAGVDDIAALIEEASRSAATQAEQERDAAAGDESDDVWGDGVADLDTDDVWGSDEDAAAVRSVWGDDQDDDVDVWGADDEQRHPPRAADPVHHPDQDPRTGGGTSPAAADEDEPEPFSFGAGPETTAPMPLPDTPDEAEEPDAFTFAVDDEAADAGLLGEPRGDATGGTPRADDGEEDGEPVEQWTVPSDEPADGNDEPDHDVWTFDVQADAQDIAEAPDQHDDDGERDGGEERSLAESARPRQEAGWRDLEAEKEPAWTVPDMPVRRRQDDEDEDEPATFQVGVEDADDADDDGPWTSPALDDHDDLDDLDDAVDTDDTDDTDDAVDLPADVVTAQVHDALGDLLGHDDSSPPGPGLPTGDTSSGPSGQDTPATAPVPAEESAPAPSDDADEMDQLDELADLDLDQFDDLQAATPDEPGDASEDRDEDEDQDGDAAPDGDEPLDAPTAAREVMEPGSVSFSSKGKKKKRRGLFG